MSGLSYYKEVVRIILLQGEEDVRMTLIQGKKDVRLTLIQGEKDVRKSINRMSRCLLIWTLLSECQYFYKYMYSNVLISFKYEILKNERRIFISRS